MISPAQGSRFHKESQGGVVICKGQVRTSVRLTTPSLRPPLPGASQAREQNALDA